MPKKLPMLTKAIAKRAGGRITVNATGPDGKPIKVVGVDTITFPGGGKPAVATHKDGAQYHLA